MTPSHDARTEAASSRTTAAARGCSCGVAAGWMPVMVFAAIAPRSPLPLRTVATAQSRHRKYNALLADTPAKTPARPHRRKLPNITGPYGAALPGLCKHAHARGWHHKPVMLSSQPHSLHKAS